MIKKGNIVKFKPEYQDKGDDKFIFVAMENQDGDRVRVQVQNSLKNFKPNSIVKVSMIVGY